MQIIVDSGATKANWVIINQGIRVAKISTLGISPLHLSSIDTAQILQSHLAIYRREAREIFFYGTGCGSPEQKLEMQERLQQFFVSANVVEVHSDLLATARALLREKEGIAAILGTGSNSCYYDGSEIVHNWGGNGYVLGDEGSGATLGKRLLNAFLTAQLPTEIHSDFVKTYQLSRGGILRKVYQEPLASRYLGSFVPFISAHRDHVFFKKMLDQHFYEFFETNIKIYPNWENLPIGISGSIGFYFQKEIGNALRQSVDIQKIIQDPLPELVEFHLQDC